MVDEKFLVDTNSFITPYKSFYPFDFAPTFWGQLGSKLEKERLCVLDIVKDEIKNGNDELSKWFQKIKRINVCNMKDGKIICKYAEVISYIQMSGIYNDKALREWSRIGVADPWLIAAATAYNYTIVTFEQPAGGLNIKNPSGKPKIPDVANQFGVKCENLYYMMRELGFKL